MSDVLEMLSTMRTMVYRPMLNDGTGSVNATLLLNQILYFWMSNGKKPFYMFMEPAEKNPMYREGASWTEIMGFGSFEFRSALEKIARKSPAGGVQHTLYASEETRPVIFWTDRARLTWYDVDEAALSRLVNRVLLNAKTAPSKTRKPRLDNTIKEQKNILDSSVVKKPPKRATKKVTDNTILEAKSQAGIFLFEAANRAAALSNLKGPLPHFPNAVIKAEFDELESRIGADALCQRILSAYVNLGYVSITNIIKYVMSPKWDTRKYSVKDNSATMQMLEDKLSDELLKIYGKEAA